MPGIAPPVVPAGLRIQGLAKAFGPIGVLAGIDLDVARGRLVTVLGASGSGKTTLLRLVCGFERPDAGRIELAGRVVVGGRGLHVPPERRGVGYVAQEGALFPHLSVAGNILFGLPRRLRGICRVESVRRVQQLLDLMDLPAQYATRMPAELSGGEQQRVALARALAPDPAVVLLDEPFSALDAGLRADTRAAVAASLRRVGATALLVTHDQDEALSMADRVAVLQAGRLAQVAAPQTLYRFPVSAEVARFVGKAVLVPGTLDGETVACCFGRLPVATQIRDALPAGTKQVQVMLRPEQVRLQGPARRAAEPPGLGARVEGLSFYGHDAQVAMRLDDGLDFTASVPGTDLPEPGARVRFRIVGPVVVYPSVAADVEGPGSAQRDGSARRAGEPDVAGAQRSQPPVPSRSMPHSAPLARR